MDLAIVERLVCPNAHAVTPLVVRADRVDGRTLVAGLLGCPVCRGEWRVDGGVARFGAPATLAPVAAPIASEVAAFLALAEPERIVVVDGVTASLITELANEFGAVVVAMDAAADSGAAAVLEGAPRMPLAASAHGVLLLRAARDSEFIVSAVRALGPGGRMLAAGTIDRPDGVRELARDERMWVGEKEAGSAPVELKRRT